MSEPKKPEIENKIEQILAQAGKLVSTNYVAEKLGVSWSTARLALLSMAVKGKITVVETTGASVFQLKQQEQR